MIKYTFPKNETDPGLLMDACVESIPGFRSGAYHDALEAFLADDQHGRISWTEDYIWVEVINEITKEQIQALIDDL